jgi:hypothetical protein
MKVPSSEARTAREEAARALNAAAEQISLALAESRPQVEALGEALQKLAAALSKPDCRNTMDVAALGSVLRHAVTRLQFYDRMTQHLSHVQDYLARSSGQMASPEPDGGWTGVHQQLSDRLLSDTQRFHLGRNFKDQLAALQHGEDRERRDRAAPGDIDLF